MFKKQIIWSVLLLGWLCTACQTPPPPPSPTPAELKINHFSAPTQAVEGETITVSWDVSGVEEVIFFALNIGNRRRFDFPTYPAVATIQIPVPLGSEEVELVLKAGLKPSSYYDYELNERMKISVTCQYKWFDTETTSHCPESEPQEVAAVYQPFERGYIIYRPDIPRIWVYQKDRNAFYSFPEHIFPSDPNDPYFSEVEFNETPPIGLEQPVGLIGRVWVMEHMRRELGWAIAPEQSYTMRVQKTPWSVGTKTSSFILFTLPTDETVATMLD